MFKIICTDFKLNFAAYNNYNHYIRDVNGKKSKFLFSHFYSIFAKKASSFFFNFIYFTYLVYF